MKIQKFHVDAFTDKLFKGNPAVVCLLNNWISDELLQNIASENNLSETAFLVKRDNFYQIRWFSPKTEIDLCGHATLAAAFVIFGFTEFNTEELILKSQTDVLKIKRKKDLYSMEFPLRKPVNISHKIPDYRQILGENVKELLASRDLIAVYESKDEILKFKPDFDLISSIGYSGLCITAKGDKYDFISRYFAPGEGINEDPVTGSAHCSLVPFWATKLRKNSFNAFQLSHRGGYLKCVMKNKNILISGKAKLFSQGEILI